jgi:hypothetical protein
VVDVTSPLEVDITALTALARELAAFSDQLSDSATVHESQPTVAQPTGRATVAVTAAANHVVGECAANLLLFADDVAAAARAYGQTDACEAGRLTDTMPRPK